MSDIPTDADYEIPEDYEQDDDRYERCDGCGGDGFDYDDFFFSRHICPHCNGSGFVEG